MVIKRMFEQSILRLSRGQALSQAEDKLHENQCFMNHDFASISSFITIIAEADASSETQIMDASHCTLFKHALNQYLTKKVR